MSSLNSLFSRGLLILILLSLGLGACQPAAAPTPALVIPTLPLSPTSPVSLTPTPDQSGAQTASLQVYKNATLPIDQRVADLLGQMTLPEKIGQMTQIETNSIKDNNLITQKFLGSVLSGGDGQPYAEGVGDRADLSLSSTDSDLVNKVRPLVKKLVVILVSGRPMIINDALKSADAFVAAWLPGTEGQGVADVLFGDQPFTGEAAVHLAKEHGPASV